MDIAFCHNDLGNYATTPKLKEHAQKWAAKNLIKGGYMLSNNNYNRAKVNNIEIMKEFCNKAIHLNKGEILFSGSVNDTFIHYMKSLNLWKKIKKIK